LAVTSGWKTIGWIQIIPDFFVLILIFFGMIIVAKMLIAAGIGKKKIIEKRLINPLVFLNFSYF